MYGCVFAFASRGKWIETNYTEILSQFTQNIIISGNGMKNNKKNQMNVADIGPRRYG